MALRFQGVADVEDPGPETTDWRTVAIFRLDTLVEVTARLAEQLALAEGRADALTEANLLLTRLAGLAVIDESGETVITLSPDVRAELARYRSDLWTDVTRPR